MASTQPTFQPQETNMQNTTADLTNAPQETIAMLTTAACGVTANKSPCSGPRCCPDDIRELAFHKWEAASCPPGDGVDFWLQAEAELGTDAQPRDE